jgi:DeoR family transcriptional regulator of aga operon
MVATSSLVIASELWGRGHVEILLLGGRVRRGSPDLVGPATELMLNRLNGDIAFIGSDALDPSRGSFAEDMGAARVAERMAAHASRVVVVADSSKLGLAAPFMCMPIEDIDDVVTDAEAAGESSAALAENGVRLLKA